MASLHMLGGPIPLTDIQQQTLDFIRAFKDSHGRPPCQAEIARHFDRDYTTISERLGAMRAKGVLIKNGRGSYEAAAK